MEIYKSEGTFLWNKIGRFRNQKRAYVIDYLQGVVYGQTKNNEDCNKLALSA